jgi:hypothetical protein
MPKAPHLKILAPQRPRSLNGGDARPTGGRRLVAASLDSSSSISQGQFKDGCMSILRDEAVSKRGATDIWSDLSWMWRVVNRIAAELVERRMRGKVDEEMAPLKKHIARLVSRAPFPDPESVHAVTPGVCELFASC